MVIKKLGKWKISEEELNQKLQHALLLGREEEEVSASNFTFNRNDRTISIELSGGVFLTFPASNIKELQSATDAEIEEARLIARGTLLRWERFDADYSIEGLRFGRFGTQAWMRELGRRGGQSTSVAKAVAARQNGQRGGRPRKGVTIAAIYYRKLFWPIGGGKVPRVPQSLDISVGENARPLSETFVNLSPREPQTRIMYG